MKKKKTRLLIGLLALCFSWFSCSKEDEPSQSQPTSQKEILRTDTLNYTDDEVETFTFTTDGVESEGLIYLPPSYPINTNLTAIYLLDFQEQDFTVVTDEFSQLINVVREQEDFEALVVCLKALNNTDATPQAFQDYAEVISDMSYHVDSNYTNNSSKTVVGRGSEGGVVLLMLLSEDPEANVFDNYIVTDSPSSFNNAVMDSIQNAAIPVNMLNKKLHFSFSSSNNQENCEALISSFNNAAYPWLDFETVYINGLFTEVYPDAFAAGLDFILE